MIVMVGVGVRVWIKVVNACKGGRDEVRVQGWIWNSSKTIISRFAVKGAGVPWHVTGECDVFESIKFDVGRGMHVRICKSLADGKRNDKSLWGADGLTTSN